MKPINSSNRRGLQMARTSVLCAGLASLSSSFVFAGEPAPAAAAAEPEAATNWVDVTVGGIVSDGGNDAAFLRRWGNNGDFYGGISDFHMEKTAGDVTFTLDGHALYGLDDYQVDLSMVKEGLGFIETGFRQYRTWYDGSGGYLPGATTPAGWLNPIDEWDDELALDRGEIYFRAGLTKDDIPNIIFGYSHRWREGQKDSTVWAPEDIWGIGGLRGVAPAIMDIDEVTDEFTLDITHTLGNTDLGAGFRYRMVDNNNKRNMEGGQIRDYQVYSSDLFSGSMFSETRINERMMLTFGYLFTTMDTDTEGSNHWNGGTAGWNGLNQTGGNHVYPPMNGGGQFANHVVNGNFWWNPIDSLVIVPSIRAEWENTAAWGGGFLDGADMGVTTPATYYADRLFSSGIDVMDITESLEIRYSGLDNILLYATAEWSQIDEDLLTNGLRQNSAAVQRKYIRMTEVDTNSQKYVIGANWYPIRGLSVSGQYYHQTYDQGFINDYRNQGTDLSKFLDSQIFAHNVETDDFNLRLTWRALPNLTFVTRYDYQQTNIDNQSYWNTPSLPAKDQVTSLVESGDITQHVLTESVTWNASDRFWIQGSFHWISSETDTPSNSGVNAVPTGYVPDWDNDYWSANLNLGYSVGPNTDLMLTYYYYSADNYVNNVAIATPFGSVATENAVSLSLFHRFSPNMIGNIRYGYYQGDDDAAGGFNDYDAHVISTGLQYRF